ncbi:hypothetical protein EJB05_41496 [Eragrostis curvula]|uniref:EF-hand domain-containing protein n=1 Tax=Eragrostis curvula TaxID=38414 RepID=A0A5J9T9V2_9POAL|nr:hypothetical protein EJB05_41496 [Eragrostis curvula]
MTKARRHTRGLPGPCLPSPSSPPPVATAAAAAACGGGREVASRRGKAAAVNHGSTCSAAARDGEGAGERKSARCFAFVDVSGRGQARLRADRGRAGGAAGARRVNSSAGARPRLRTATVRRPRRLRRLSALHGRQGARALPLFQATIDVEHKTDASLPEELWTHASSRLCLDFWRSSLVVCFIDGIEINDEELARFVEHVDKDNNGIITFEEWRDFLLLYPNEVTIENIYHHWERVCLVDIGEQAAIPEGIRQTRQRKQVDLIAGGIAGAASRTATAPLDRLKVIMQVQTTRYYSDACN